MAVDQDGDGDGQGDHEDLGEEEDDEEEHDDDNIKTENPTNEGEKKQNGWQVPKIKTYDVLENWMD